MLILLTDPKNNFIVDSVAQASASLVPPIPYKVIDFTMGHRSSLEEATLFGKDIALSTAAIIDIDLRPTQHIDVRIGSVAGYLLSHLAYTTEPKSIIYSLDKRILFITENGLDKSIRNMYSWWYEFYSVISSTNRTKKQFAQLIATWLGEILNQNKPRVFISYRSTKKSDAEKLAISLRARGAHVWFDDLSIPVGSSIIKEVNRGLGWCTHFIILVDEDLFDSLWASAEFDSIMYRRLSGSKLH